MVITAIQNYKIYNHQIKPAPQCRFRDTQLKTDSVTISPSFRSLAQLEPYFRGKILYNAKTSKEFDKILASMDLSGDTLKRLLEKAKFIKPYYYSDQETAFKLDFLIRNISAKEIKELNNSAELMCDLRKIIFSDENKSKVKELIDIFFNVSSIQRLHEDALRAKNVPLLNLLIKDMKGDCFKDSNYAPYTLMNVKMRNLAEEGRFSSGNSEIRELFSGSNLYNFFKHPEFDPVFMMYDGSWKIRDIGKDLFEQIESPGQRKKFLAELITILSQKEDTHYFDYEIVFETLALFPATSCEKRSRELADAKDDIKNIHSLRIRNLVKRNGFDSPANWLLCLKDSAMSEEVLRYGVKNTTPAHWLLCLKKDRAMSEEILNKFKNTTLIENIAGTKLEGDNKEIMTQIIEELSKFSHLPDDMTYKKAALMAAKQGNADLLRFFDSRHIHYADMMEAPVNSYPQVVQEILLNAKKSNEDINSADENGMNIAMHAVKNNDLKTLESLAQRDDFDWNMVDKYGDNLLMQIINKESESKSDIEFKKQAIKIIRELPEGKFDINYVNYLNYKPKLVEDYKHEDEAYTALSLIGYLKDFNSGVLDEVLKFKEIDTNFNPCDDRPFAYSAADLDINFFEKIYCHPNTNRSLINNEDFQYCNIKKDEIYKIVEKRTDFDFLTQIKTLYDKNGMFTLEELKKIVYYPNFNNIMNEKINIVGETIGHFLAETFIDEDSQEEFRTFDRIFTRLNECNYDFNSEDDFGVTPLAKAKECKNKLAEYSIRRFL